jgi:hypothetical protein
VDSKIFTVMSIIAELQGKFTRIKLLGKILYFFGVGELSVQFGDFESILSD